MTDNRYTNRSDGRGSAGQSADCTLRPKGQSRMTEMTKEQWEAIPDSDTTPFTVTAHIYTSVFHDHVEHEMTWTGTKAEIEQQAARYATVEMADYPLLHMEIASVKRTDDA